jgi:hypothetical protein
MLSWFSPCVWGHADGYVGVRNFYHGTAIGRGITNAFWSILGGDVLALNKYDSHPETAKLKPWSEAMFTASSFSILNYPTDFFDVVRGENVRIHIADIEKLSAGRVHLSDGTMLQSDALCCATGWKHLPPLKFLPEGIDKELGVPHTPGEEPLFSNEQIERADKEILSRFPRLKDQPVQNKNLKPLLATPGLSTKDKIHPSTPLTPYTLYRFMVPPSEKFLQLKDIAFAGVMMNFGVSIMAHVQSLWISAFFDGALPQSIIPSPSEPNYKEDLDKLKYETLLYSRFGKFRYPAGHGHKFPDFVFDSLPYIDLILGDLTLDIYRKGGWLAEATQPYGPEDYKDLVDEWKEKQ